MMTIDPDDWDDGYRPRRSEIILFRLAMVMATICGAVLGILIVETVFHILK